MRILHLNRVAASGFLAHSCLIAEIKASKYETTSVTFRHLDEEEIQSYLASGESFDKAGAYGIQGLASRFVTRVEGCYFNVVGLPVALVYEILRESVGCR